MLFYDVKLKKKIKVPHQTVRFETLANGRKAAVATLPDGRKLYRFVKS